MSGNSASFGMKCSRYFSMIFQANQSILNPYFSFTNDSLTPTHLPFAIISLSQWVKFLAKHFDWRLAVYFGGCRRRHGKPNHRTVQLPDKLTTIPLPTSNSTSASFSISHPPNRGWVRHIAKSQTQIKHKKGK